MKGTRKKQLMGIMGLMPAKKYKKSSRYFRWKFWLSALRYLPNHALLKISSRSSANQDHKLLSYSKKHLPINELLAFDEAEVTSHLTGALQTELWHGNGRFQYVDGKPVDIFKLIVERGSLLPISDLYATLLGGNEPVSSSATSLRVVARAYADMHGLGEREPHRYESSMLWVSYYYGFFYAELFLVLTLTVAKNFQHWNKSMLTKSGERAWARK